MVCNIRKYIPALNGRINRIIGHVEKLKPEQNYHAEMKMKMVKIDYVQFKMDNCFWSFYS